MNFLLEVLSRVNWTLTEFSLIMMSSNNYFFIYNRNTIRYCALVLIDIPNIEDQDEDIYHKWSLTSRKG